ncbi:outer membrane homotrimeric porin [Desulfomicrobium baculatum]|uniref:Porin n=1 Tax=Desulfomicrobium baculatum (strain DSM 4028 / VKM B-1378 / X) TaxID=525897 RepID=C7LV95_DESBD|nr:outer membrane homotrimeric porin [Desulfomicrobium baculatum]ACU88437.1 conserved hypothetical protein [Desulfomicrobium baculatum DSM 4028]
MKRFTLVALVAALLFSMVTSASATELKVRGNFDVYGMWSSNLNDHDSDVADGDNYTTVQRMRTYFDYVANENLKAVLGFEFDNVWGAGEEANWGTDGKETLEVKHAYLDFIFPDTQIEVQAGLQYIALPSIFGNPVFDDDAAAITVAAPINDMFGVTVGYTRGTDMSNSFSDELLVSEGYDKDDVDMAFIATPVTLDGVSVTPYFGYAWLGQNSTKSFDANDDSTVWVVGANAALTMFDPLTFAADLIYGEGDSDAYETKGWYAALAASYKMDMLTATLFTTYATGYDEDTDEDDKLPTLAEGWGLTPYVGGDRAFIAANDSFGTDALGVGNDGTGLWVLGLVLDDISFVDKLSHKLVIAYAQGTSDEDATKPSGAAVKFTEEDDLWELWLVNKYMIYENLAAINELGYFQASSEVYEDATGDDLDSSYFATVGFQYKF